MKFTEHLAAHITPEWRSQYINYAEMKDKIQKCAETLTTTGPIYYKNKCEKNFFTYCVAELDKVDKFFISKLSEAKSKFVEIKRDLLKTKSIKALTKKQLSDYRFTISEFYLSLILLQNYQKLNYNGFRNILSKHDKILKNDFGKNWLEVLHKRDLYKKNDVNLIIEECEQLYINELANGDRVKAMDHLRLPSFKEVYDPLTIFRIGFYSGVFFLSILYEIIIYIVNFKNTNPRKYFNAMPLYRGSFFIILQIFLWCINLHVYRKCGINQILIFDLDPRNHIPINDILEIGSIFALLWTISFLAFIYDNYLSIPIYLPPIMLYLIFLLFILNPTKTLFYSSRMWALKKFFVLCLAPTYLVKFPEYWLGDQFISLKLMLLDIKYTCCFIKVNPKLKDIGELDISCHDHIEYTNMIIEMLPPWWRCAQAIRRYRDTGIVYPHLVIASKFSLLLIAYILLYIYRNEDDSFSNKSTNPWFYIAMLVYTISNIYCAVLDMILDWGMFQIWKGKKLFLRDQLAYPQGIYYFAMIEDCFARMTVIGQFVLNMDIAHPQVIITIMGFVELFRRFIWNFFRLENEHFNNVDKFRVHRDISVRPRVAALFGDDRLNEEFIREDLMDEIIASVIKDKRTSSDSLTHAPNRHSFLKQHRYSLDTLMFNINETDKKRHGSISSRRGSHKNVRGISALEYDSNEDL